MYSGLKKGEKFNKELVHKCERGNKSALLWLKCQAKQGTRTSSTYPVTALVTILLGSTLVYCLTIEPFLIQVLSESEAHKLKGHNKLLCYIGAT